MYFVLLNGKNSNVQIFFELWLSNIVQALTTIDFTAMLPIFKETAD